MVGLCRAAILFVFNKTWGELGTYEGLIRSELL